ncbi:D-cysteine desulfhydrase family protein [Fretibacter rubidus]|uniref:D-cysteine desulfhydrase family protein n=1 Tax=Fretibacter rubidus TaxID=570162 RepID=UPI00352B3DDD
MTSLLDNFTARLSKFPSVGLVDVPTPLRPMPRLSEHLGGPNIWIKRDDATHISSGGNKLRKLDRVLYTAVEQGCDTLVSGGVPQSNSQRQVATAAAILGLDAALCVFTGRVENDSVLYQNSGNIVLNTLFGATLYPTPWAGDRNGPIKALAEKLRAQGRKPFVVPYGVSNAMGALSYSSVIAEIAAQTDEAGIMPKAIIAASGSGGTQAGVSLGVQACLPDTAAICIDVDADAARVMADAVQYAGEAATLLDIDFDPGQMRLESGYSGEAYGIIAPSTVEAMTLCARLEGVILDPVYTGKALAGLIGLIRAGEFARGEDVVFIHTGGAPATFAYADVINDALSP